MANKKAFGAQDKLAIGALRALVIDSINAANSGHPGMALDAAPIVHVLYRNHVVADPRHPRWINRDRVVWSAGHASALIYAGLHLMGYDLPLEEVKKFRRLGSITPGHPEIGVTAGVDASAGPLGQGISQAVGMAMAEEFVKASYPEGSRIMDHKTWCLCGDGCLEEGLSQESIALAGFHKLKNLILIYDANGSTLDGPTSQSANEDVKMRFMASDWDVVEVKDGEDLEELDAAFSKAEASKEKPTLVYVHTIIGFGSANQGKNVTHGKPLGEADGAHAKEVYGYHYGAFEVPEEVYAFYGETFGRRGLEAYAKHEEALKEYAATHPNEYKIFVDSFDRNLGSYIPKEEANPVSEASRLTSGKIVASLAKSIPFALGGSADVAASVMTAIPGDPSFTSEHRDAHNINFGIREFAMAGVQNGMLLHGGVVTYVGCFLVFSDYMKSAIRMASLEKLPAIYLFSHDSIAVGEDGPTHEPIEHLAALRTIPGLITYRPADSKETYYAWKNALLSKDHPTAIILSRQALSLQEGSSEEGFAKGAYLVYRSGEKPTVQLLASGSEVGLAIEAAKKIKEAKGIDSEVISMPSMETFKKQDEAYKASLLHLPKERRFAFEMGNGDLWYRYADHVKSIDEFGLSGNMKDLLKHYGWTADDAVKFILDNLK